MSALGVEIVAIDEGVEVGGFGEVRHVHQR
jgi:hypothetical protein